MKARWVLSLLLLHGCAHQERVVPQSPVRTDQPRPMQAPSAAPGEAASPSPAPDSSVRAPNESRPPADIAADSAAQAKTSPSPGTDRVKSPGRPPTADRVGAAGVVTPKPAATSPPLDLTALEQRLRDTHAIGVFTKLSLKNQVDDLLDTVRAYHSGRATLQDAKQQYDSLLLKVLTLLQDGDPPLASSIRGSREALWNLLADRDRFQKLHL